MGRFPSDAEAARAALRASAERVAEAKECLRLARVDRDQLVWWCRVRLELPARWVAGDASVADTLVPVIVRKVAENPPA